MAGRQPVGDRGKQWPATTSPAPHGSRTSLVLFWPRTQLSPPQLCLTTAFFYQQDPKNLPVQKLGSFRCKPFYANLLSTIQITSVRDFSGAAPPLWSAPFLICPEDTPCSCLPLTPTTFSLLSRSHCFCSCPPPHVPEPADLGYGRGQDSVYQSFSAGHRDSGDIGNVCRCHILGAVR